MISGEGSAGRKREGPKCQAAYQVAGLCFSTLATTLGYAVELSEPLKWGQRLPCQPQRVAVPGGACPSVLWPLLLAGCVPTSLTEDGLLGNKAAVGNIPASQHVLGVGGMGGGRSDDAVGERTQTLRSVMGEGAGGQEAGEGELRWVLLGTRGSFSHPQPTLPMPPPCPGDAQV